MKRSWVFFAVAAVVVIVIAVVVSQMASRQPDGLQYVGEQQGFTQTQQDHPLAAEPLAKYGNGDRLRLALSGLVGVAVAAGIGFVVFRFARSDDPTDTAA